MRISDNTRMLALPRSFYTRDDVVQIARELLGKVLCTSFDEGLTSGLITETEAYAGVTDRASHAYGGRRTGRTEIMYSVGGTAYVYLCYGIHSLFNVVTSVKDNPHAVLIRAIRPLEGIDIMKGRANKQLVGSREGTGPGNVSRLLGIHYSHTGMDMVMAKDAEMMSPAIWIEDRGIRIAEQDILSGPRVGVDYAGEDALLPYRFSVKIR